jgi:hypothetical protein
MENEAEAAVAAAVAEAEAGPLEPVETLTDDVCTVATQGDSR